MSENFEQQLFSQVQVKKIQKSWDQKQELFASHLFLLN